MTHACFPLNFFLAEIGNRNAERAKPLENRHPIHRLQHLPCHARRNGPRRAGGIGGCRAAALIRKKQKPAGAPNRIALLMCLPVFEQGFMRGHAPLFSRVVAK